MITLILSSVVVLVLNQRSQTVADFYLDVEIQESLQTIISRYLYVELQIRDILQTLGFDCLNSKLS